jgi:predicted ribosomally synthesized peptide with SipW-like signal peptide
MDKRTKILRSAAVVAVVGSLGALGVFAAFSSQTENPGNSVTAGTVELADNDGGTALYSMPTAAPGDSATRCIQVTYSGSLPADVAIYTDDAIGALGSEVTLDIDAGTQDPFAADCTGFAADAGGALFNGSLASFAATHSDFATGLVDHPGDSATEWVTDDAVVYRVTATLDSDATLQGETTGTHALTWEAQNQ